MKLPRNADARDTTRSVALVVLIVAACLAVAVFFHQPIFLLLKPSYWTDLLSDRAAASTFLGSVATGILTISAGILTVLFYRHQQRDTNWCNFFKWLTDFHVYFHRDEQFGKVRLKLAEERCWVRRQLTRELLLDAAIPEADVLEVDKPILCAPGRDTAFPLDWTFLREFTDYLYFFEQILIFGETLYYVNSAGNASVLVDHFGWFLRSLYASWDHGAEGRAESLKAKRLFVLYLANNRYLRLTSVALIFMEAGSSHGDPHFRSVLFEEAKTILGTQGQAQKGWGSLRELEDYWLPVVGQSGFVAH